MIFLAIFILFFGLIYALRSVSLFRQHLPLTGILTGILIFSTIYLLGINDQSGGSIMFFNFFTLLIPTIIADFIDPRGNLDVTFILVGAFIEFTMIGFFIGKLMESSQKKLS